MASESSPVESAAEVWSEVNGSLDGSEALGALDVGLGFAVVAGTAVVVPAVGEDEAELGDELLAEVAGTVDAGGRPAVVEGEWVGAAVSDVEDVVGAVLDALVDVPPLEQALRKPMARDVASGGVAQRANPAPKPLARTHRVELPSAGPTLVTADVALRKLETRWSRCMRRY